MEKTPLISIVILNYNGVKYLSKTLELVFNINYSNKEIVIVDNCSTDGSIKFLKKLKNIKLIENKKNLGYSAGKNIGVRQAKGKFILLLDEDILIDKEIDFNKLIKSYVEKNIAFISFLLPDKGENSTYRYGGFFNYLGIKVKKPFSLPYFKTKNELVEIPSPDGGAIFFERKFFLDLGGYDESQPYYIDVGDIGPRACICSNRKTYLQTRYIFVHLGVERKGIEAWCEKYKYTFSGNSAIIIKNYSLFNLFPALLLSFIFFSLKTLKHFIVKKDFRILKSFITSIIILIKNLKYYIGKRNIIQGKRINSDIFLKIKWQE